jgi:hypothetical protein
MTHWLRYWILDAGYWIKLDHILFKSSIEKPAASICFITAMHEVTQAGQAGIED